MDAGFDSGPFAMTRPAYIGLALNQPIGIVSDLTALTTPNQYFSGKNSS
jgi:hypothetical protein